jgi:hypothetical protein
MDNKKFEQLIDLVINENEEQARAMFHDIVVEKSREIYESLMMDEEYRTEDQVGTLQQEIGQEEVAEEEDEFADIETDDGEVSMDADEFGSDEGEGEEGLEDRVVDLEDKLDELMAEFEELMAGEEGGADDMGGDDMGGDDMGGDDFGGDEEMMEGEDDDLEESEDLEEDAEETLEESTQLQAVKNPVHGDNGQNSKSIVSKGPKVGGNGAKAVNFSGESTKGGTQGGLLNPATKDLKGAGSFKNAPGQKGQDLTAAPKPKHGDNGSNTKSITSESRKTTKRIVK